MLLTVIAIAVGTGAVLYSLISPASFDLKRDRVTSGALSLAKEALIGRAATDATRPGSLPCPDIDNDGDAESPVAYGGVCPSYIGRFPWKTLGVSDLRDGNGERLWYALTPSFRDHSTGGILNSDTPGQLTITGVAPASGVIATVFSPGAVVGTQARDTANQNNVANYLEGGNETGITTNTFVTAQATSSFNDKLLPITSDALFSVVTMRVVREIRTVLRAYYAANGYFPNANRFSVSTSGLGPYPCEDNLRQGRIPLTVRNPPQCTAQADWGGSYTLPSWFANNNWNRLLFYAVSAPCAGAVDILCDTLGNPLTLMGSPARALMIGTGRGFTSQANRPCGATNCTVTDLLEDAENTNGNDVFVYPVLSPPNNDRLVVVSP